MLDEVKGELADMPEDASMYFDSSRPRFEFITALALEKPPGKALDLGCSPGFLAMALSKLGWEVLGVDLNKQWLKKYVPGWPNRLGIRQVEIERERVPEPDASFDLVIFTEVLEHIAIQHPSEVLLEIRRLLRQGGSLLLSTPNVCNASNLLALAQGKNIFWDPPMFYGSTDRHNREFTPLELLDLLEGAEFSKVELGYANSWSNWNHHTADQIVHNLLPAADPDLLDHPLFQNTLFALATV
ncbi:MAG: class I SAM-dependent methyltransferase [Actinomycetota bacterium]